MPRRCKEKPDKLMRAERNPDCPYGGDPEACQLHYSGLFLFKLRRDGFESLREVHRELDLGEPFSPPVVGWTEETLYFTEVYYMLCLDRFYEKTGISVENHIYCPANPRKMHERLPFPREIDGEVDVGFCP